MQLNSFLRCGYTFTPDEYELETRYVFTTAALAIISVFLMIMTLMYYILGDYTNTMAHGTGVLLTLISLYLARKVGKNNYAKLVYVMTVFFLLLTMYAYYLSPTMDPVSAWIIIQILASFLVLNIRLGILITIVFSTYVVMMNSILGYNSLEFILLKISPVIIAVGLVAMIEKKFLRTIFLLEESNKNLEERVKARTKDIEEEKRKLDYQAHYDFLTDIPNRNKFYSEIQQWIQKDTAHTLQFALMFIDLDRFKRVNDSLGHDVGDNVLKVISRRIQKNIPKKAFFSRISGDEFTILFPHGEDKHEVKAMAKRLIAVIEEPITLQNHTFYLSASIGISCYPQNSIYYADLIKYADTTMFEAKKVGRGTYKFYDKEMTHHINEVVLMDSDIHAAFASDTFLLYYQPQIDTRTNAIVGLEALVRWDHPTLGFIYPDAFIPYAEETGVIIALDYFILQKGMKQIVTWKEQGLKIPRISFNFSTKHLQQKGFVEFIETLLAETRCKGQWIELEITESHIMENIDEAIRVLQALKDLGITIAIDDFGTGYSSLTYLKRLPADKLKIDKSFIEQIPNNSVEMTITNAIIHIGNSLGLQVIAEGVETSLQEIYLTKQGCHYIQGYLHYEAISKEDIESLLKEK
ncbi:EAL domain-containing protein [Sulfurovum sp. NBC37-1]|uniref:EAL domain-containing protein n=1 Tax=Sulfurovum sp. (strain NBC37-1) TaxID=387093 RepID=UPI000158789C|nr:EAL domain-containing protein [Sulfurovum sp. NBC37-1]BAF71389.1 conserved hypothetical protein [Sulfurovum sp. NBC37-1]